MLRLLTLPYNTLSNVIQRDRIIAHHSLRVGRQDGGNAPSRGAAFQGGYAGIRAGIPEVARRILV